MNYISSAFRAVYGNVSNIPSYIAGGAIGHGTAVGMANYLVSDNPLTSVLAGALTAASIVGAYKIANHMFSRA